MSSKILFFCFLCISGYSQIVNNKVNSGGLSNNVINYEIGLINVILTYPATKPPENNTKNEMNSVIANAAIDTFAYFPNPVSDKLFVEYYDQEVILEIEVYNELGQQVLKRQVLDKYIDMSILPKGMYLIIPSQTKYKAFNILKI